METGKNDWKLFREKLPEWQEQHIEDLVRKYQTLLSSTEIASDKFWKLDKMIRRDKKSVGVQAELSKSEMYYIIRDLLVEKIIGWDDLDGFSDDLLAIEKRLMTGM